MTEIEPEPQETGALGLYPERVYVPNSDADTIHVIDPATFEIVATYPTGALPHHVTPSWDLTKLYVDDTVGNTLLVIDPATAAVVDEIPVEDPYNLYFTPDGSAAVVVAERLRRLDIRDPNTWELVDRVEIPWPGVDHLAFSQDGSYLVASTEFSGRVVKVGTAPWQVIGEPLDVGGEPIDVIRPPNQALMYVANQERGGVHIIDPDAWVEVAFIETGAGAHGILLSRDQSRIYVSNRNGGSMSVIDLATNEVVDQWDIPGGSPDMGQLNPDGTQLWISGRYHSEVYVIDTTTGQLISRIPTDPGPHGLTYFPNSTSQHSIGHNGINIED